MRPMRVLLLIGFITLAVAAIGFAPAYGAKALTPEQAQALLPAESSLILEPGNSVEATIFDVPLRVQIDVILTYLFMAGGLGFGFLCAGKIKNMLANTNRRRAYEFIVANPGCTIASVSAAIDMNIGTVNYHLNKLEKEHKIHLDRNERNGKFVLIYPNALARDENYKKISRHVHNGVSKGMLLALLENPGITNKRLTEIFQLKKSTVSWHIDRFFTDGLVSVQKDGRLKRYFLSGEVRDELCRLTSTEGLRAKCDLNDSEAAAAS